ncbi:hypothetical protein COT87_02100 [Candidatus Collierbacteria bacterium CG10_big_fil_rev_8_21_14_0_10_44_9]|uniref:Uncharacterized protein n=1 Tax=Candidatus Collierbacteria bacterium CG10_big_fil_rev_8_21_14_0_10_44_9 TaxID=1974535 RepID=A0A2H0VIN4_9BACT|nr:MAG: hypothetical protein COT87_02100 [Candidatus Collierbacteria bacterium CG10_big_fil_rev_8_21_14_0_10_44_9]
MFSTPEDSPPTFGVPTWLSARSPVEESPLIAGNAMGMYTQEMKSELNFWRSLEVYTWKVVRRSPLPYQWIGIGLVVLVIIASVANVKSSVAGARGEREVIERAARVGDYETARKLYSDQFTGGSGQEVLGAESKLEDLVYPEQKLAREIEKWESGLAENPGNREIMRGLAQLYEQVGNIEKVIELREQIRILDPNE